MRKAVGYVRVSTTEQAVEGISIDMQRAKIRAYAALEDFDLIEIVGDEGISGCTIKGRPGIQKIIEMVEKRRVEAVVVFKLDRLARNTIEALELSQLMHRKGVALHSITEKLDTRSAIGKFFFTLMASLAEMERGLISERIKAALAHKRQKNQPLSNNPPYGTRVVNNLLVPDPEEWAVIRRILKLHSNGFTAYRITRMLTDAGILNRRGKAFDKSQIRNIIFREAA
ncbi:MAG: recombinase family protein [Desulfomonilaceae bacterium]